MRSIQKSDHPGYSFERTHWVLVTGVEPLNWKDANVGRLANTVNTVLQRNTTSDTARHHTTTFHGHPRPRQKLWNYCNTLRDDGLSYGDF